MAYRSNWEYAGDYDLYGQPCHNCGSVFSNDRPYFAFINGNRLTAFAWCENCALGVPNENCARRRALDALGGW